MDLKTFLRTYTHTCDKCGKLSRIKREYCTICETQKLRKTTKDDYMKVSERMFNELKEEMQLNARTIAMLDKTEEILQALVKNEAEHKKLLKRKKTGESVRDLITKNRDENEKLNKVNKENSERGRKWIRTEEGEKWAASMAKWARINPNIARKSRIFYELQLRMTALNHKIQKNEDEFKELLERKNKGDYVDDLTKQNRYAAESLKESKKNCESAMNKLRAVKKTDWKSKMLR
ncbi:MAG: hypothetical protein ACTSP8_11945 [Promethearchaeota archaeon]